MTRYSKRQVDLQTRVRAAVDYYGSYRNAARAIGVDASYLHRLGSGDKVAPSDALLRGLHLRRVVFYETVGDAA